MREKVMNARKTLTGMLLVLLSCGVAIGDEAPDPSLSDKEREHLVTLLGESLDMLMGLITGLSDEQWTFKQNADRWSVQECTEHIVRSERALLDSAILALSGEADPEWYERTNGKVEFLERIMPNRNPGGAGGASAPQEIRPTEQWSRSDAIQKLYNIRGEVRAFAETIDRPIKEYTTEHPFPVFNWLNAHDWLIYIPLHTIRHSKQIIEVQEDKNYPEH